MKFKLPRPRVKKKVILFLSFVVVAIVVAFLSFSLVKSHSSVNTLQASVADLGRQNSDLQKQLDDNLAELQSLKNEDQYKINKDLKQKVASIESTYQKAVNTYESLLKLKENTKNTSKYDEAFTKALTTLAKQDYESADKELTDLAANIASEQQKIAASFTIPASVPVNNTPPGSGYSRQTVNTDIGQYLVSLIAGDLSSTKIIVDTASSGTCTNDCPVLSLADYVSRNGGYAGVNGSYFCPATYPSCAGKTNSFDTLLMNKDKVYFNSDNNVYSSVPAVIFGGSYIRFVGSSSEWGRDTGIDSMIANQPLLVSGSNVVFGGDSDPKKGSKAGRSFVANKGNTVYIGVVHSSTVAEAAIVLKAMGMENALNLDSGGSTALWSGGYKVGPGRNIPNAIVFIRK